MTAARYTLAVSVVALSWCACLWLLLEAVRGLADGTVHWGRS